MGDYVVSKWSQSFSSDMAATQLDEGKAGFQVRYEVRETSIGKGLFLLEPVAKGALIWRYREGENILCFRNEAETRKHLDSMASDADRKDFLEHAYHDGGALNFILDDGGLWNHSDKPNTGSSMWIWTTFSCRSNSSLKNPPLSTSDIFRSKLLGKLRK